MLFVCSLNNEVALFCVCVVCFLSCNKTIWYSGLHLVVLFFLFYVVLLFHSFQEERPKTGHSKNKKSRKKDQNNQLAQLCSQIVFLIVGGGLQNCIFAENPIKKWFRHI